MSLWDRPRWWALLAATVAISAAAWLLFAPMTAVYVTSADDPTPREVTTRYSWSSTEQILLYSDAGMTPQAHLVSGIRLHCGNAVTTDPGESALSPAGPRACAMVETPRCIAALSLFTVGLLGLLGTTMLPATTSRSRRRYRLPYRQRRALKRGR